MMNETDNFVDRETISALRKAAERGVRITDLVSIVKEKCGDDSNALTVTWHFMNAFNLSLSEVREISGAKCLGNDLYSDDEIEKLLQPLIQAAIKIK